MDAQVGGSSEKAALGAPLVAPLGQGSLKDRIVREMKAAIMTGRIAPGTVHTMGDFASQFQASRTPVREALLELEARGFIEISRSVGFRVASPTERELQEVAALRELLEVPVMEDLAGRLSAETLLKGQQLAISLVEAAETGDVAKYVEVDGKFHMLLVHQWGNTRLSNLVEDLRDVQRMPSLSNLEGNAQLISRNRDHLILLKALESGDAPAAGDVIRRHIALS